MSVRLKQAVLSIGVRTFYIVSAVAGGIAALLGLVFGLVSRGWR